MGCAPTWEITMAGEDQLACLLNAWRNDIERDPFPSFTLPHRTGEGRYEAVRYEEQLPRGERSVRVPDAPSHPGAAHLSR
jgi:hypothetical protein